MVIPVEYAVAVDRFLSAADIGDNSRRVYRIALTTWAWLLVDREPPAGPARRSAAPPVVPLALLCAPGAGAAVAAAFATRAAAVGPRTANRELSILRGAVAWWTGEGWLDTDPTTGLRPRRVPASAARLGADEVRAVLALDAPLRDKVFWHLVHESGASVERLLALDTDRLDLPRRRSRSAGADAPSVRWRGGTAGLLPMLVVGRAAGPLFLTDRRAPAGTPAADRCPYTGRARLSYRRAAEIFTAATRPLDPAGRGWTLRQLQG
ncbi:integrase/recombinase XerD [Actinacidiphila alni]|uniref:Integrase/recombinase XerD n=1 Tax=Actinacidiphila alni TaxID=380248 RepID=A0A1I2KLX5_9ACTN|nr:integrase/recombinase XerD [Actinacidiphila alni]